MELELETEELMTSIEEIAQENIVKQQALDNLKTEVWSFEHNHMCIDPYVKNGLLNGKQIGRGHGICN